MELAMIVTFTHGIGDTVTIRTSNQDSEVVGLLSDRYGRTQAMVRFADSTGCVVECWEYEDDLAAT